MASTAGIRSCSRSCNCEIVVFAGSGSDSVVGRLRPGKEVKRTLTVDCDAMFYALITSKEFDRSSSLSLGNLSEVLEPLSRVMIIKWVAGTR